MDSERPVARPDLRLEAAARAHQQQLTKPPGSAGVLEELACWFAARTGAAIPEMPRCEIFVFAADHGVAARGVSAFPQAVTAQMLRNFAAGGAAINVLARLMGCDLEVVDVGVATSGAVCAGVRDERIRAATHDFSACAAMSQQEAERALEVGARCVSEAAARRTGLLIAGEMGIANTTSAACLICAFTREPPARIVGRGTGVDDLAFKRKREIVSQVCARLDGTSAHTPLRILSEAGGFEIAAMAGFYIEAARRGLPILLDGYISAAAALCAEAMVPGTREWMLASHRSGEAGHGIALRALGLTPLLDFGMRLGEGTGAALALPIIRAALALHREMATFAGAGVSRGSGS